MAAPSRAITFAAFAAAALGLLALAYGSLLPFDLHAPTSPAALLAAPRWYASVTLDDMATNLALYLPVAAVLGFALRRCGMRWWWRWGLGLTAIASLVWVLECLQSLSPHRYASLNDWLYNVVGAAAGLVVSPLLEGVGRHVLSLLRRWLTQLTGTALFAHILRNRRRIAFGLMIALVGLVGWYARSALPRHLTAPTTDHLNLMPLLHEFMMPYLHAAQVLAHDMAIYATLSLLAWVCLRLAALPASVLGCAVGVMLLALATEAMQLFDASRYPDITQPLLAAVSAAAAVFVARLVVQPAMQHRQAPAGPA